MRTLGFRLGIFMAFVAYPCHGMAAEMQEKVTDIPTVTVKGTRGIAPRLGPRVFFYRDGGGSASGEAVTPPTPADNNEPTDPCEQEKTANPVVVTSGNKVLDEVDFATEAGDFVLARHYSKNRSTSTGFGPGWSWTFGETLTFTDNPSFTTECEPGTDEPGFRCPLVDQRYSKITARRADGYSHEYTWNDTTARYEDSRPQSRSWIVADYWSDQEFDKFTLHSEDGAVERYNHLGRVVWMRDRRNVGYSFSYVNDGSQLHSVTHTSGRKLTLAWNSSGRITAITAPNNKVYGYGYVGGRLTSVTYPDSLGNRTGLLPVQWTPS